MKIIVTFSAVLLFASLSFSQEKTNDEINRQIRSIGVDHITVSFDASGGTSKLMAVADNFSNRDADNAGVRAINFAMGFFYPGTALKSPPETIHFTFWVLTKRPRFADNHHLTVEADGRTLDIGDARYAAKPAEDMEYLNFELSRADLAAIAAARNVSFHIGPYVLTATPRQINTINAVAKILAGVSSI